MRRRGCMWQRDRMVRRQGNPEGKGDLGGRRAVGDYIWKTEGENQWGGELSLKVGDKAKTSGGQNEPEL